MHRLCGCRTRSFTLCALVRPVIFLDIDGVVVTPASMNVGDARTVDVQCVAELNRLVEAADAEIVVTSSWRTCYSLDFITEALTAGGFRHANRVIGHTDHLHYRIEHGIAVGRAERFDEILAWLSTNPREHFVVLDDDFEAEVPGHFVRTASDLGLTARDVDAALAILRRDEMGRP